MTAFAALLRKDLRVELSGELAAGVLVPTLLFAALLAINRLFVAEREEGGFDLIRLAPVQRTVLFAAKASALVIYLVVLELIAVPIFALFFLDSVAGLFPFPLVIAAAGAGEHLLAAGGPDYERFGTWLMLLGLYDLIFLLVGYATFDFLLED